LRPSSGAAAASWNAKEKGNDRERVAAAIVFSLFPAAVFPEGASHTDVRKNCARFMKGEFLDLLEENAKARAEELARLGSAHEAALLQREMMAMKEEKMRKEQVKIIAEEQASRERKALQTRVAFGRAQVAEDAANWRLADQLTTQALDLVGTHDPAARLELLLSRSLVRGEQWNFVGAREDATDALALAEQSKDPVQRARHIA
jgi:hypothetical protein